MNRLKTLLIVFLFIAQPLTLAGCGLVGALGSNKTEISSNLGEELPEWLTVAHRVQAAEQAQTDTEDDESRENDAGPIVSQPAATQPGSTQPAQQAEQQPAPQPSGTPRWQQPGTMEYIAKLQIDQVAFNYKALNKQITDYDGDDADLLKNLKKNRADLYETMNEVAASIGLNLDREYSIKPPPVEPSTTPDSTWFYDPDHSPSGFSD